MVQENQREVKLPITVPTQGAQKQVRGFSAFMKREFVGLKRVLGVGTGALRVGAAGAAGAFGGVFQAGTQVLRSPLTPFTAQQGDVLSNVAQGGLTAAGAAAGSAFGPAGTLLGGLFGNQLAQIIGSAIEGAFAKQKFVSGGAVQDVQGIVSQFAQAGVPVSDADILRLLNQFKAQRDRMFDAMQRVATLEGGQVNQQANQIRNLTRVAARRTLGWFGL